MSRDKKPQKANKQKYADPKTGEFRHADGDRRRRGSVISSAKEAIKIKKFLRELGSVPLEKSQPGDESAGGESANDESANDTNG